MPPGVARQADAWRLIRQSTPSSMRSRPKSKSGKGLPPDEAAAFDGLEQSREALGGGDRPQQVAEGLGRLIGREEPLLRAVRSTVPALRACANT